MRKNFKNGFTLMEMLIVVAIISVLVAIGVPAIGNVVTRARAATDAANVRGAKAAAAVEYMMADTLPENGIGRYYYDGGKAHPLNGSIPAGVKGYGLSKEELDETSVIDDLASGTPYQNVVVVTVDANGVIAASWGVEDTSGFEGIYGDFTDYCGSLPALETMGSTNSGGGNHKTNLVAGSTFTYDGTQYIFNDHFNDTLPTGEKLKVFAEERINNGKMFKPTGIVYTDATKAETPIQKGDLWQYKEKYYVAVTTIENPPKLPTEDKNSWIEVSLPKQPKS